MAIRESGSLRSVSQRLHISLCLAVLAFLAGCGGSNGTTETSGTSGETALSGTGGGFKIVTTTGMVTDIVAVVAGDRATVTGLVGEGVDPHLFTAGRNDVRRLLEADIVFFSGLLLEGRIAEDLGRVRKKGKPVIEVTTAIEKSYLRTPPEFEGHPDPHVWMDVSAWSKCVSEVARAMAEFDPPNKAEYEKNAADYLAKLTDLDQYIRERVATIPESQRYLITAHDAFGYFAKAYGIKVKAIQGISTESEAGISDITELIDFIVENQVPSIFVESSVSSKNITAVIEGCAAKGFELTIGGELYSDAMGAPGTYEGTYIGMMDHNATTVARSLGGEAPEQGWQKKLTVH
ncbi:MAG: zinc ABC transporter substrate-binding protein [Planctomycetota bacterium]|nr:zinc ABC transporter substrate-binding protein [Planctomycetota bacterium]MDA1250929.1 zinc ABC transporter substrate-binding protein [Planctomycetota bacterium]